MPEMSAWPGMPNRIARFAPGGFATPQLFRQIQTPGSSHRARITALTIALSFSTAELLTEQII
jgi:hypothetical protein